MIIIPQMKSTFILVSFRSNQENCCNYYYHKQKDAYRIKHFTLLILNGGTLKQDEFNAI